MDITKREIMGGAAAAAALAGAARAQSYGTPPPSVSAAEPISRAEHLQRLAKLQGLMQAQGVDLVLLEPGAAMTYFSGLRWWRSERLTAVLAPKEGDAVGVVTPYFEEPSVQETIGVPAVVRTWHENEYPFAVVRTLAEDWGGGAIAMEESVRFFVADGVRRAVPGAKILPGAPLTRPCRMIKSPAELALMQAATDATIAAYAHVGANIAAGMTPDDVRARMNEATRAHGGSPTFASVLFDKASAYPHGTDAPQIAKEGGIVLMDCGCSVHGYQSDVSRTFVIGGEATKRQQKVWDTVRRGQEIVFETARIGLPAGAVDDAVRRFYTQEGWGPGYQTPGLSHRTGHGIGMEGHEPINLVQGETTPLAAGMCFSNEPGLYDFDHFGVRLEDCFVVTEEGPKPFSGPQPGINRPV